MSDEKKITLYSYSKVWKVEKKVYSIYNIKLPVPINLDQGMYMLFTFLFMCLPAFKLIPTVLRFLVAPVLVSRSILRIKLDGKNPLRYFVSFIQYIISETGTCLERFQVRRLIKEDNLKICWVCSQGNSVISLVENRTISNDNEVQKTVKKKEKKMKIAKVKKEKNDPVLRETSLPSIKPQKRTKCLKQSSDEGTTDKRVMIYWMDGFKVELKDNFIEYFKNYVETSYSGKAECTIDSKQLVKDIDTNYDIKIILCTLQDAYLKTLASYIREHKKVKRTCKFIFLDVDSAKKNKVGELMEGYRYFCFTSDLVFEESILQRILE